MVWRIILEIDTIAVVGGGSGGGDDSENPRRSWDTCGQSVPPSDQNANRRTPRGATIFNRKRMSRKRDCGRNHRYTWCRERARPRNQPVSESWSHSRSWSRSCTSGTAP